MSIQSIGAQPARSVERAAEPDAARAAPAARVRAAPSDSAPAATPASAAPTREQLDDAVANINKSLQSLSQDLEFSVDQDSNRTIVKVVDQQTKEVIRQIPSSEALEIAKALDTVKGLLIRQTA